MSGRPTQVFVATVAALQEVHVAPLASGSIAWVEGEEDRYFMDKSSGLAENLPEIVAPIEGAPIAGGPSARWLKASYLASVAAGSCTSGPLVNGAVQEILPAADPFPTSATWYADAGKTTKLLEQLITRDPTTQEPTTIVWNVYVGGVLSITVTDVLSYSGPFVTDIARSVT